MQTYPIPMVPGPVVVPDVIRQVYLEPYGSGDLEMEFIDLYSRTQRRTVDSAPSNPCSSTSRW